MYRKELLLYIHDDRSYNVSLYRYHHDTNGMFRLTCHISDYDPMPYCGGVEVMIAEGTHLSQMSLDGLTQRYEQEILAAVHPLLPHFRLKA